MKRDKTIYRISTGLVSLGFLAASFMYLSHNETLMQSFSQIGIPAYFVTILGVAKLTGSLAIINPWSAKLREWAYAGFAFTLIGATWVHIATGTPFMAPIVFLLLLGVSYYFHSRVQSPKLQPSLA